MPGDHLSLYQEDDHQRWCAAFCEARLALHICTHQRHTIHLVHNHARVRYRIVRLATKLKDAAVPWVDSRMKDLWRDVVAARAVDLDDGSDLKTNGCATFPAFHAAEMADAAARSDNKKKELLKEKKGLFDALAAGSPATFDADVANNVRACTRKHLVCVFLRAL